MRQFVLIITFLLLVYPSWSQTKVYLVENPENPKDKYAFIQYDSTVKSYEFLVEFKERDESCFVFYTPKQKKPIFFFFNKHKGLVRENAKTYLLVGGMSFLIGTTGAILSLQTEDVYNRRLRTDETQLIGNNGITLVSSIFGLAGLGLTGVGLRAITKPKSNKDIIISSMSECQDAMAIIEQLGLNLVDSKLFEGNDKVLQISSYVEMKLH